MSADVTILRLVGAVVVFRDITARKRSEEQLQRALAEVERLKQQLQAENVYLQEEIKLEHNFEDILSHSDAMQRVLRKVALIMYAGISAVGEQR